MNKSIFAKTLTVAIILTAGVAFGADKAKSKKAEMEVTAEQRQTMATNHEKMAVCLRSEKPMEECRMEMMKSCGDGMGEGSCPMMGKMHGKMKHHKMTEEKESEK